MGLRLGLGRDNTRIFLAMIFNEGSLGVYNTLWPLYIASLGATPPQIGLVIGLMGFARLLALLPSGALTDRVPARRLIVAGRSLAVVGLFLIGSVQQWWQLIPASFVMAAATVAFPAISNTIAERAGSGWERTRAFTLIYTVGPSGAYLVTPILGGFIAAQLSLRAIFFAALLLMGTAVAFFATITPGPAASSEGPPAGYRTVLGERPLRVLLLTQLVTILVLTVGITLVPNFLQEVHGVSIERIGWLGSLAAVGSALLGLVISRVRLFRRPLAGTSLAISAVAGMMALLLVGRHFWAFGLAYLLRGGYMVAWSTFYAALGEVAPDRLRGRVYALAELGAGIGMTVAPFIAGWLYAVHPSAPLGVTLVLIVPLLAAVAWTARSTRAPAPAAPVLVDEGSDPLSS